MNAIRQMVKRIKGWFMPITSTGNGHKRVFVDSIQQLHPISAEAEAQRFSASGLWL